MTRPIIRRSSVRLYPDRTRVLLRPFLSSNDPAARRVCAHVMTLREADVRALLRRVLAGFSKRHRNLKDCFARRFEQIRLSVAGGKRLTKERKLLLGAYFCHEYSIEAAALFNPSIVPHPDQSSLPKGSLRFVLSLRATGEGHISSITFRSGVVDARSRIELDPRSPFCIEPAQVPNLSYDKTLFERQLKLLGLVGDFSRHSMRDLANVFTVEELQAGVERASRITRFRNGNTATRIIMLAYSNFDVRFPAESDLSERVLFPATPAQRNGIEDARFVQFRNEDGSRTYYATYTAYDGRSVRPELIETRDFVNFRFIVPDGPAIRNKGMALFPRKIRGRYTMLGRQDSENLYVMVSDTLHSWRTKRLAVKPRYPWEFARIGNCGSPLETKAGWLVLTHGVGAMRTYGIGALLLDLEHPTRVIGRMSEPLIQSTNADRDGYVPNVVYSCGGLLHGRNLIIPYAMADYATAFATCPLDDVLAAMA